MSHEVDGGILSDGYFLRSGFPRTCCHDLIFALIDAGRQPDMSLFFSSVRPMLDHGRPTPVDSIIIQYWRRPGVCWEANSRPWKRTSAPPVP